MKNKILVYGATGYTGKLFIRYAQQAQLPIVIAGRSSEVAKVAQEFGCAYKIFSIADVPTIAQNLAEIKLVVNLAGAFVNTNQNIIKACIQTQTHYIDIAGEYPEFETAYQFNNAAQEAGMMVMAGAGFGVVPTDIAANLAQQRLPDAQKLVIGFATEGGASQGTLKTVLKDIHKAGIIRQNGKAETAQPAFQMIQRKATGKTFELVYNPWRADLFTTYLSTNIPNIETYSAFPSIVVSFMKGKLLWLRDFLLNYVVNWLPLGPSDKELKAGKTYVWATASNTSGQEATVQIIGTEAYLFTTQTLLGISKRILQNDYKVGFQTPNIYGKKLLEEIPAVEIRYL